MIHINKIRNLLSNCKIGVEYLGIHRENPYLNNGQSFPDLHILNERD